MRRRTTIVRSHTPRTMKAAMHIVAGMGRRAERSRRVRAISSRYIAFLMITAVSYGAGVRVFRPPPPVEFDAVLCPSPWIRLQSRPPVSP